MTPKLKKTKKKTYNEVKTTSKKKMTPLLGDALTTAPLGPFLRLKEGMWHRLKILRNSFLVDELLCIFSLQ